MSLQSARLKAGYSQHKLAAASGVNVRNIQQYEIGTRNIDGASLETLCKLATTIGCTLFDLLEDEQLKELLRKCT